MDYKEFFKENGDRILTENDFDFITVEELAAAIEARILAKLEEQRIAMAVEDWDPTFGDGPL